MKTLLVDPTRCLQCSNCWVACMDEHRDNDWFPIAAQQGEGQWWIRIEETEAATGVHMKLHRVPIMCQQCEDAPCMKAAKDAAAYRRDDGIILFDPEKAKGQKAISDACPYGCAFYNEELQLPQKCTMCAHLLDEGRDRPRCVKACPSDALQFVDTEDLMSDKMYAPLERLYPEFGTKPHVAVDNKAGYLLLTPNAHKVVLVAGLQRVARVQVNFVVVHKAQNLLAVWARLLVIQNMVVEIGHACSFQEPPRRRATPR